MMNPVVVGNEKYASSDAKTREAHQREWEKAQRERVGEFTQELPDRDKFKKLREEKKAHPVKKARVDQYGVWIDADLARIFFRAIGRIFYEWFRLVEDMFRFREVRRVYDAVENRKVPQSDHNRHFAINLAKGKQAERLSPPVYHDTEY